MKKYIIEAIIIAIAIIIHGWFLYKGMTEGFMNLQNGIISVAESIKYFAIN